MSVVPFRRPAAAAPAVMPSAQEIEAALRAARQAIVSLGEIDFADLAGRILAASDAEQDEDLDTAAQAAFHLRSSEAHALFVAATFRDVFTVIERVRVQSDGGRDAAH